MSKDIELDVEVLIMVGATFGLEVGESSQKTTFLRVKNLVDLRTCCLWNQVTIVQ